MLLSIDDYFKSKCVGKIINMVENCKYMLYIYKLI